MSVHRIFDSGNRADPNRDSHWEGPRERLQRFGSEVLSDAELIAALFQTGATGRPALLLAEDLLRRFAGLCGLWWAGDAELPGWARPTSPRCALPSSWVAATASSHCGPESVSRAPVRWRRVSDRVCVTCARKSSACCCSTRDSLNQSLVHPREVYGPALREAAAGILVLHNHPSGDPEPSR